MRPRLLLASLAIIVALSVLSASTASAQCGFRGRSSFFSLGFGSGFGPGFSTGFRHARVVRQPLFFHDPFFFDTPVFVRDPFFFDSPLFFRDAFVVRRPVVVSDGFFVSDPFTSCAPRPVRRTQIFFSNGSFGFSFRDF